mmetsp:Transcript_3431/g.5113  ORF Transcript_3431/g.5113 Transcript_3431/m.5113 type:complete len:437 (+) Transcript_3431:99-1409(+)|eukprot:CAMPEP_0194198816 /NCGR_PEP_ID=MMETSP0156-20130528/51_1 /TAXON_ID=33649 /ORGANISM="Thalassionema nitzschioides, Strain L26-B" /LENGTH=436 /DNA_ID=CAMNT_0038923641 /DNA_START=18 /DNA_END=1328 /DNA_ORIENTATION=-
MEQIKMLSTPTKTTTILLLLLLHGIFLKSVSGFQLQQKPCRPSAKLYLSSPTDPAPPCVIQVLGVGGGGGNAVNRMIATGIEGVAFWAINTDVQALATSLAKDKLNIGRKLTKGLGAGGKPSVGYEAAMESREEIDAIVKGSDMIFITAGMGGGTGSGAAPVVAEVARANGCLTVGVVTKPFGFEGRQRMKQAEEAITNLKKHVDTLIVVSNDKLLRIVPDNTPVMDAFLVADDILRQGVLGISEIILKTGMVNVDFADVKTVMSDAGTALMGVGTGVGKNRAANAAIAAISSPLLDIPFQKARRIVFNVVGGDDMGLQEINEASEVIYENSAKDANIIFGALVDPTMGDEMSITVLACDFADEDSVIEMRDAAFYKERRLNTKSPLGADAASVEDTRKAISRGFTRPPDDDEPINRGRKGGRFSSLLRKFLRKNR